MAIYGWISQGVEWRPNKWVPLVRMLAVYDSTRHTWTYPTIGVTPNMFVGVSDLTVAELSELDALEVTHGALWTTFEWAGPNDQHTLQPAVRAKVNQFLRANGLAEIQPGDGASTVIEKLSTGLQAEYTSTRQWDRLQEKMGF